MPGLVLDIGKLRTGLYVENSIKLAQPDHDTQTLELRKDETVGRGRGVTTL